MSSLHCHTLPKVVPCYSPVLSGLTHVVFSNYHFPLQMCPGLGTGDILRKMIMVKFGLGCKHFKIDSIVSVYMSWSLLPYLIHMWKTWRTWHYWFCNVEIPYAIMRLTLDWGISFFISLFFCQKSSWTIFEIRCTKSKILMRTRRIMVTCMLTEWMSFFRVPSLYRSNAPLFFFALEIHSFYQMCMFKVMITLSLLSHCVSSLTAYLESLWVWRNQWYRNFVGEWIWY